MCLLKILITFMAKRALTLRRFLKITDIVTCSICGNAKLADGEKFYSAFPGNTSRFDMGWKSVPMCVAGGLYLGHPYNITVSSGAVLGMNVNLHKGCTIGRENRGKREGCPTIGSCVSVGINATVVGNISIGDDVMIAAGAFVNHDVPSHSICVGNPCRIISRVGATDGYIVNRVGAQ